MDSSGPDDAPLSGDRRRDGGDGAIAVGTNGTAAGTNGGWFAYGIAAAGTLLFASANIWSGWSDRPDLVRTGGGWQIVVWEYTSATMILCLLPLIVLAIDRAGKPEQGRILRFAGTHVAGWCAFFLLHVGGFILLRKAIYALHGWAYHFGGADHGWLYEAPKDVATYAILAITLGLARARRSVVVYEQAAPLAPTLFTIRDGARSHHVPFDEIVAITSAGNYAEFLLADGRRPLMRTTLAAIEAELATHGFVRTHRSWLVNPTCLREIAPTGGGDYRLSLAPDVEAPLSRRYAAALDRLRRVIGAAS